MISGIATGWKPLRADAVAVGLSRTVPETRSQRLVEIAAVVERLRPLSDPAAWGVVCYSSSRKELSSPWNPDQDTSLASGGSIAGSEQT